MIIGSVSENKDTEKRISVTPDNVKKFISNGFKVYLEKNYGQHLDIDDKKFTENGATFFSDKEKIIKDSDILLQLNLPDEKDLKNLSPNKNLIGVFDTVNNKDRISKLSENNINVFSLELLPRITRAQSMDILSSQANLAGYKAVVDAFSYFNKEPKKFSGGELYFPKYKYKYGCENNSMIIFPGWVEHGVSEVKIKNSDYYDGYGRYSITNFFGNKST